MTPDPWFARAYRAPATTVAAVALYLSWVLLGTNRGLRELFDHEQTSPVRLHFVHTDSQELVVSGHAVRTSLRQARRATFLRGPSTLHIRGAVGPRPGIRARLAFDAVRAGEVAELADTASGLVYSVAGLEAHNLVVTVPLAHAASSLTLSPPSATAAHRWLGIELVGDAPTFAVAVEPGETARVQQAAVCLGSGLWRDPEATGLGGPPTAVRAGRIAHLQIVPATAGRHRLCVAYRPASPAGTDVTFYVDGRRVTAESTPRAGGYLACFSADLGALSLLSVDTLGPLLSPLQMGHGRDERPYALEIDLAASQIEGPR